MTCGNGTKRKDDPFAFRNHFPLPVRAMIGIFGAVLLFLPYYLLIAPQWNHFSWLLIPFGIIGLVAGIAGLVFVLSAIMGEARETRLDLSCQTLTQTGRDFLYRPKITRTAFSDIAILELSEPGWATEETVLTITPVLENGDSLPAFGAFPSREEAQKIMALMGHVPDGLDGVARNWTKTELEALRESMEHQANKSGSCGSSCGCSTSAANRALRSVH